MVSSTRISRTATVKKYGFMTGMLRHTEGGVAGDWVGITAAEHGPASVRFGNGPGLEAVN